MDSIAHIDTKHYKIDTYIKDTIKAKYNLEDNVAEAISLAVDMKDQDMSGYSTKGDMKTLDTKIDHVVKDLKLKMYKLHFTTIAIILGAISKLLGKW
jgi:hypothetical protein